MPIQLEFVRRCLLNIEGGIDVEIQIGYYVSHHYEVQDFFPFHSNGGFQYIIDIGNLYSIPNEINWLSDWMMHISPFPIYFCCPMPTFFKNDYEKICKQYDINFQYLIHEVNEFNNEDDYFIAITKIINIEQFRQILPAMKFCSSIGCEVIWSVRKNIFSYISHQSQQGLSNTLVNHSICVDVKENTSFFLLSQDGDFLTLISNEKEYSTFEGICSTLPPGSNPTECKIG